MWTFNRFYGSCRSNPIYPFDRSPDSSLNTMSAVERHTLQNLWCRTKENLTLWESMFSQMPRKLYSMVTVARIIINRRMDYHCDLYYFVPVERINGNIEEEGSFRALSFLWHVLAVSSDSYLFCTCICFTFQAEREDQNVGTSSAICHRLPENSKGSAGRKAFTHFWSVPTMWII